MEKLYLIGGLGADERVFKYLDLKIKTHPIIWIHPKPKERLHSYAKRLSKQININEDFGILGVSFGGIIALEIAKFLNPKKLILVSSVEISSQLPKTYIRLGKTRILNLLPNALVKPPKPVMHFLFGAKNKNLLSQILDDTEPEFIKWALNEIVKWSHLKNTITPIRIHGTHDRVIPLKGEAIVVEKGAHFMIVDKSNEISDLINMLLDVIED